MMEKRIYIILILCLVLFLFFLNAPVNFPTGSIVRIEQGDSLRNISLKLQMEHVIRSRIFFEAFVIMFGQEKHIISSDYYLEGKLPVYEIAKRIAKGEHRMPPLSITIPEGFDVNQIADVFSLKLNNFNRNKFLIDAKSKEGFLFPDTYFFFTTDDESEVLKLMSENFEKKISQLRPDIFKLSKTEKDIIIMASLLEREAKGGEEQSIISGILWKRLSLNMLLQVDADKETYKIKGLPKAPIANPGLNTIKASMYPKQTPYLYYLHDKAGGVHYAKSFDVHNQNINKYLK